jgi:hypothetical protein
MPEPLPAAELLGPQYFQVHQDLAAILEMRVLGRQASHLQGEGDSERPRTLVS